jgi:hypothetical protein
MKEKLIIKLTQMIEALEDKEVDEFIDRKLPENFDLKDLKKLLRKVQEEQ